MTSGEILDRYDAASQRKHGTILQTQQSAATESFALDSIGFGPSILRNCAPIANIGSKNVQDPSIASMIPARIMTLSGEKILATSCGPILGEGGGKNPAIRNTPTQSIGTNTHMLLAQSNSFLELSIVDPSPVHYPCKDMDCPKLYSVMSAAVTIASQPITNTLRINGAVPTSMNSKAIIRILNAAIPIVTMLI